MPIDFSTDLGRRVQDQLRREQVIWLTTTAADGTPQPRLVWFLWERDSVLIYSQPGTAKLGHIARSPRVALHFNSDPAGHQMSVLLGTATVDGSAVLARDNAAYLDKYREAIADLGSTPEQFSDAYAVPIRVRLERLRGF